MKYCLILICFLFRFTVYAQTYKCETALLKLINCSDEAIGKLQSDKSNFLAINKLVTCLDTFMGNCEKSIKTIAKGFRDISANFKNGRPSKFEGVNRSYESQFNTYLNSLISFRLYLQMVVLENRQTEQISKVYERLDSFIKIQNAYNTLVFSTQKVIKDSVDSTLNLIRKFNNQNINILKTDSPSITQQYEILIKYFEQFLGDYSKKVKDVYISKQADTILKNNIGISAFQNSLYGIFYYHSLNNKNSLSWMIGPEIIFPINSQLTSNLGFFFMSSMQDRKLMLQVGLGWIKNVSANDVSWKCGIVYFPSKLGIGISYSPLTGFGTNINWRLK